MDPRRNLLAAMLCVMWLYPLSAGETVAAQTSENPGFTPGRVEPEPLVVVTLDTGETLRGVLLTQNDVRARLLHPALGQIDIPNGRIRGIARAPLEPPPSPKPAGPAASPRDEIEQVQEEAARAAEQSTTGADHEATSPKPASPARPDAPKPAAEPAEAGPVWSGSIEFGLSGSKGNTDRLATRTRAAVRRQSVEEVFSASLRFRYTRDKNQETENELLVRARQEWLIPGSRFHLFAEGDGELNRFRDYDALANGLAGLGYEFLKSPDTLLIGRLSAGAGYQDGGRASGLNPRARAAMEFRHAITPTLTFTSSGEITPELNDVGEFRSRIAGAFDIALNDAKSLRLRVGAEDRFDSDPGRREAHDIDYFVTLVYAF